jgi:hypothetical protein
LVEEVFGILGMEVGGLVVGRLKGVIVGVCWVGILGEETSFGEESVNYFLALD